MVLRLRTNLVLCLIILSIFIVIVTVVHVVNYKAKARKKAQNFHTQTERPRDDRIKIVWCTINREEQQKCHNWALANERDKIRVKGTGFKIECYQAFNKDECMALLDQEKVTMTTLDAGEVFVGGRYHSLVPISQEVAEGGFKHYYAVAVVKKDTLTDVQSLHDLRGKKACFASVETFAGWIVPIYTLMHEGGMEIVDCNNHVKSAINFFGPSCAVNSLTSKYNPIGDNSDKLCQICTGKLPGGRCTDADPYAGYDGAFRCLLEIGDVAFLKHTTIPELVAGDEFISLSKDSFELLCKDGSRRRVDDYLSCNWGRAPSNAIVTTSASSFDERQKFQLFLEKAARLYKRKHNTSLTDDKNNNNFNNRDNIYNNQPEYDAFGNPISRFKRQSFNPTPYEPGNQYNDPNRPKNNDPNDRYGDPNNRPNDPNNPYSDPNNRYGDPNSRPNDPNNRYNDPNNPYSNPNNRYGDPNNRYGDLNSRYGDPSIRPNDPNNPYNDQNNRYGDPNDPNNPNNDPKNRNDDPNNPNNRYGDPNRFDDPNRYNDPNRSNDPTPYDPNRPNDPNRYDPNRPNDPNRYDPNRPNDPNRYDPNRPSDQYNRQNDPLNPNQNHPFNQDPFNKDPYRLNREQFGINIDPYGTPEDRNKNIYHYNETVPVEPNYDLSNGTLYELFSLFESTPRYGIKSNLIFHDSTIAIAPVSEQQQTYTGFLENSMDIIQGIRECQVNRMTLCVTSDVENQKCVKMKTALKAQLLKPEMECYKGHSQIHCMQAIRAGTADVAVLDASDIYTAGLNFGLVPFISEVYNLDQPEYYVVAVAKESDPSTEITYLKGKNTCHGGINTAAGWTYPMAFLLSNGWIRPYGCNSIRAAAEYFSKSCVPGAISSEYNTDVPYDNMCDLCHGSSFRYCRRDASEDYYGHTGAFRCLVEGGGHVAFVKHTTVTENTGGKRKEWWARDNLNDDFELLCTDGTRAEINEYEKCNLGRVKANAIVARGGYGYNETHISAFTNLFLYAQTFYGRKTTDEFSFSMFSSMPPYTDLIFQDATTQLQVIPLEQRDYAAYLGSDFMRARRITDCHSDSKRNSALIVLLFTSVIISVFV